MSRNDSATSRSRRAPLVWMLPLALGFGINLPPLTRAAPSVPAQPATAPLAGFDAIARPTSAMIVHVIDVGQASSTLLEFPRGAVLVDAGNEKIDHSDEDQDASQVVDYLEAFFRRRTDLDRTLQAVIITHPHIDHTSALDDVMDQFNVQALIDGGNDRGSGIRPLQRARTFAREHRIKYVSVSEERVPRTGLTNRTIDPFREADDPDLSVLAGSRGCSNANNDSLVVLVTYAGKKILIDGDAETTTDSLCGESEVGLLLERYSSNGLLDVDLWVVGHHGSDNG